MKSILYVASLALASGFMVADIVDPTLGRMQWAIACLLLALIHKENGNGKP